MEVIFLTFPGVLSRQCAMDLGPPRFLVALTLTIIPFLQRKILRSDNENERVLKWKFFSSMRIISIDPCYKISTSPLSSPLLDLYKRYLITFCVSNKTNKEKIYTNCTTNRLDPALDLEWTGVALTFHAS